MQGNENWKWGAVFILLAIFLVTANQAYKTINQEDFEPPDDWQKGDSWDLENSTENIGDNLTINNKDIDNIGIKEKKNDSSIISDKVIDTDNASASSGDGIDWDKL